jgi:hypothetical protein
LVTIVNGVNTENAEIERERRELKSRWTRPGGKKDLTPRRKDAKVWRAGIIGESEYEFC